MKRLAAWVVSIGLMVAGILSLLTATSLLRPATNPMSDAAPQFQMSMLLGTLVAAAFFLLSELAARRWSAPARGWKTGWYLVGGLFLVPGVPLLLSVFEDATPLLRRTLRFQLGMGGLYVALGIAACGAAVAGSKRRV